MPTQPQKYRTSWWLVLILAIFGIGIWYFFGRSGENTDQNTNTNLNSNTSAIKDIENFADCAAAGYPVQESYPRRCAVGTQTFVEIIGNELELMNIIQIAAPRPNATVVQPIRGTGQARGTWFFEATFPVVLEDDAGRVLATSSAQSDGEWMTEEFVPFTFTLATSAEYTGRAWVVLEKSNPSGSAENDAALRVPVILE